MRRKSFNRGRSKLRNKGYSKQSAFNKMKGLAKMNRFRNNYPPWVRYLSALVIEFILLTYKVPSKEDVQITLIQTIIPLSDAAKPLAGVIPIIALLMQIISLLLIYDLLIKLYNTIRRKFKK